MYPPPLRCKRVPFRFQLKVGMWKHPHVVSSREDHAQKLCHKGTTGVILYQVQKNYVLQDESLLEIVLFSNADLISWLLMSISKD